jgi:hypothetical protein
MSLSLPEKLEVVVFLAGWLMLFLALANLRVKQLDLAPRSRPAQYTLATMGLVFVLLSGLYYIRHGDSVKTGSGSAESASSLAGPQNKFVHEPATPPGKAVKNYYVALKEKNWLKAWGGLTQSKRDEFNLKFKWNSADLFGKEGFRTTQNHEQIMVQEDPNQIDDGQATVQELIIVTDLFPKNPATILVSAKTAGEVLAEPVRDRLVEAIFESLETNYEVKLDSQLKGRLKTYILSRDMDVLQAPDFVESIALLKQDGIKNDVLEFKLLTNPSSSSQKSTRQEVKRLIVNRRKLVRQGNDWLIGDTAEGSAIAVYH